MRWCISLVSMIEVARPQSAIVRERGRALIIQAEPQPPRYTILTEPTAAARGGGQNWSSCPSAAIRRDVRNRPSGVESSQGGRVWHRLPPLRSARESQYAAHD